MNRTSSPTAMSDEAARRHSIAFLNLAHGLDHFVLLIYPTVVIGRSLPRLRHFFSAGWLADRWSRRNMMATFYFGCSRTMP